MNEVGKRSIEHIQGSYLTIISIVQGTVLAYLMTTVLDTEPLSELRMNQWLLFGLTLFLMIQIWHEYWIGTNTLPFVPTMFDSTYPFLLGVLEFLRLRALCGLNSHKRGFF